MTGWSWLDDAACRQHDPELWFAGGTDRASYERTVEAKRVCRRCPVAAECLTLAATLPHEVYGVWGGLDAGQVRRATR